MSDPALEAPPPAEVQLFLRDPDGEFGKPVTASVIWRNPEGGGLQVQWPGGTRFEVPLLETGDSVPDDADCSCYCVADASVELAKTEADPPAEDEPAPAEAPTQDEAETQIDL